MQETPKGNLAHAHTWIGDCGSCATVKGSIKDNHFHIVLLLPQGSGMEIDYDCRKSCRNCCSNEKE